MQEDLAFRAKVGRSYAERSLARQVTNLDQLLLARVPVYA